MLGNHRVLVTGGAGFIGSHLVERLLSEGHEVIVIDNFSTGRIENLSSVQTNPRLTVHKADIQNLDDITTYFQGVDWVFHLAARADIVPSIQTPLLYHQSNVDGTIAVLEASRRNGIKRFLYSASSSCYGIPDVYPTPESFEMRPMYPYALTKYIGEQYVFHWNTVYKLPCVSLRFFNVYGPRARTTGTYGAVFGVFLAQKLARKPLTVVGDGTQTRDFTFVTDVVDALVKASASSVVGEAMNVGSGGTYSVNHLVSLIGSDVVYITKRPGEPDCTFADTKKIHALLGWKPTVPFEKGVGILMESIEEWRNAPVWDPESIADATKDWFTYLSTSSYDAASHR